MSPSGFWEASLLLRSRWPLQSVLASPDKANCKHAKLLCSGLTLLQNESINATKGKLMNICYTELRKCPAYLILFLLRGGKKSVYTWTENWGITKMKIGCHARNHQLCFLISLRATDWFFNTTVSVGKCAVLSRVLRFTPKYVNVSNCLLRKCEIPCLNTGCSLEWILRSRGHLLKSLPLTFSHDSTFRWL